MIEAPITVLVVDDEDLSRHRLRALLAEVPGTRIVGECGDGVEALNAIAAVSPELVFLDVQMPELDGLGVLDALGEDGGTPRPEIIFTTAFNTYLERAFEVHAVDYLRKPYTDARFTSAMAVGRRRVLARRREIEAAAPNARWSPDGRNGAGRDVVAAPSSLDRMLAEVRQHEASNRDTRLKVRNRDLGTWDLVPRETIDWIASDGNGQVRIHAAGKEYPWRRSLAEVEQLLDARTFLRVHRSFLVNVERVRQIKTLTKGEYALVLADGTVVDTGRSYRRAIEAILRDR